MEPHDTARSVSPELVLVDPELAARARAALPDHPWPAPVRIEPQPPRSAGSRIPAAFWTFGFSFALILLISGLSLVSTDDRPTFAAGVERKQAALPATTTATTTKAKTPRKRVEPKRVERTRSVRTRPRTNPRPAVTPQAETTARAPRQAPQTRRAVRRGFRPARIFSWPPHAGASYYQVSFLRNGKPFYRTQTNTARLRLPQGVRFTAGSYRWTVRPAIASDLGIQLARPIVDSTFEVSGD